MGRRKAKNKRVKRRKQEIKNARRRAHEYNRDRNKKKRIERYGRAITKRQFDAYCFTRQPLVRFTAEEIEWYSLFANRLLGIVLRDVTDDDFGFVILGRDTRRLFRCIDVGPDFYQSPTLAREALALHLAAQYEGSVQEVYPQGDETEPTLDLFTPKIPEVDQHPNYTVLMGEARYEAARNLITEIANSFIDNDGHFEREFQSTNFHSRLWELYLHMYFHNAGLGRRDEHQSPDFELDVFGRKIFVEAVTVNPSRNPDRPDLDPPRSQEEIIDRLNDYMPIKFGSPLYSKLQKRYWDLQHVAGNPLVLAVHDYHNQNAMTWTRTALSEYLYGIRARNENGVVVVQDIESHDWQGKTIPSGFFKQQDAVHISAVLFSNQATIPKFNRMGKIAGLGSADVKMIRQGLLYNPEPGALEPIPFSKDLDDEDYEESWSDGLIMFHNPNAALPIDPNDFPDISHISFVEGEFVGIHQPYDVLGSITIVVNAREREHR